MIVAPIHELAPLGSAVHEPGQTHEQLGLARRADPRGAASAPSLSLSTEPQPGSLQLEPGHSVYWQIGVSTRSVSLASLRGELTLSGSLADAAARAATPMTVALASCSAPWRGAECPGTALASLPAAALDDSGMTGELGAGPTIPAKSYVLATITLPADAPESTLGQTVTARLEVTAAGEQLAGRVDAVADPTTSTGAMPRWLADTGSSTARLARFAVLALGSIAAGAMLAAIARRRYSAKTPGNER